MAQVDASIPLQVQLPQQQDMYSQVAKTYQLKDMIQKDQLQQQQINQQAQLKDVFANADTSTPEGKKDLVDKITKIDPQMGIQIQKDYLDQDLTRAKTAE